MENITIPVDGTDPIVVGVSWALTQAVGRWGLADASPYRLALPYLAVALAAGARVAIDVMQGADLSTTEGIMAAAARAFASGAAAVWAHSATPKAAKAVLDGQKEATSSTDSAS